MRSIWLIGPVAIGLMIFGSNYGFVGAKARELNPYTGNAEAIKDGRRIYFLYGCNGCHGGTGGGGMAAADPLFDDHWKYGSSDKTLFKVIKGEIPGQIMPAVGKNMTEEEIWKVIAWIRSIYKGNPDQINW